MSPPLTWIFTILAACDLIMTGTAIVGLLYHPPGRVLKTMGWTSLFLFSIYLINTYVFFLYGE